MLSCRPYSNGRLSAGYEPATTRNVKTSLRKKKVAWVRPLLLVVTRLRNFSYQALRWNMQIPI